jgi:hypothetical protein
LYSLYSLVRVGLQAFGRYEGTKSKKEVREKELDQLHKHAANRSIDMRGQLTDRRRTSRVVPRPGIMRSVYLRRFGVRQGCRWGYGTRGSSMACSLTGSFQCARRATSSQLDCFSLRRHESAMFSDEVLQSLCHARRGRELIPTHLLLGITRLGVYFGNLVALSRCWREH